jgi:hypothetical protein
MKLQVSMTEEDLKNQIVKWFNDNTGFSVDLKDIQIKVKSKQNYRSEWEIADFKATIDVDKSM